MNRRFLSPLLGALPALLPLFVAPRALAADKPNILWLTSEDHGPEMGCYGDPNARTPNAEALAAHGPAVDLVPALAVLRELAPPDPSGVFAAMAALSAIEALGPKAASLHPLVRTLKINTGSPDARFNSYIPRLITNITGVDPEAAAAKAKGKKKAANP